MKALLFMLILSSGFSFAKEGQICFPKPGFSREKGAAISEAEANKSLQEKLKKVTDSFLIQIDKEKKFHRISKEAEGILIKGISTQKDHKITIRNDRKEPITAFWFSFKDQGSNNLIVRDGFYGWTADPLRKPCPFSEN